MKKRLLLLLASMLLVSICMGAFAAVAQAPEIPPSPDAGQLNTMFQAGAAAADDAATPVQVTVTWPELTFDYTVQQTWNPDTLTWDTSGGTWKESTREIEVQNSSEVGVNVAFAYAANEAVKTVTGKFSPESLNVPAAKTGKVSFTIDGALPAQVAENVTLGTITVTVTAQSEAGI